MKPGLHDPARVLKEPETEADRWAREVIGAAIEVHRVLGPGYLESVYQHAMEVELRLRGIPFSSQQPLKVKYKDAEVGESHLDLWIAGKLIVELKAVEEFHPIHTAQVISYLKSTGGELGLLINFNVMVLKNGIKRVVLTKKK